MLRLFLFTTSVLGLVSLSFSQNKWVQLPDFPGPPRNSGVAATFDSNCDGIDDSAIYGLGFDSGLENTNDLWCYNSLTCQWDSIGTTPFTIRRATMLSFENKLYFFAGSTGNSTNTDEVWVYDPFEDNWVRKSDYPPGPST